MGDAERGKPDDRKTPSNPPQQNAWPVIMHETLNRSELSSLLRQKQMKVRFSGRVVPGSIIFPQSALAFMLVPLSDAVTRDPASSRLQIVQDLQDRLGQLIQVHRDCYLLCQAPLHGETERNIFSYLQTRYLHTQLGLIPVHNSNEAVKCMMTMAKTLCKPYAEVLSKRIEGNLAEYQQRDVMATILLQLGLDKHQCGLVADGLGSVSKLSTATKEELLDCCLDSKTADSILAFFRRKHEPGTN